MSSCLELFSHTYSNLPFIGLQAYHNVVTVSWEQFYNHDCNDYSLLLRFILKIAILPRRGEQRAELKLFLPNLGIYRVLKFFHIALIITLMIYI